MGLVVPDAVTSSTEDYRYEMDYIGHFLEECTHMGAGLTESNTDLYNVYLDWCKNNHIRKLGRKSFSQSLMNRGLRQGASKKNGRHWEGIELNLTALDNTQLHKRFLGHLRVKEVGSCN